MTWLLDLDGVVWLSDRPIPGSPSAVARLRAGGRRVVFLTNNSSATVGEYLAKLTGMGIEAVPEDLITSAQAAASLVEAGQRVLVCAGPGVEEAVREAGAVPVREGPADAVVVGWHRDFGYARLDAAFQAVHGGARLIGTNDDPTYPTPSGLVPGGGALLAAVAYATGVEPVVAGKPFEPVAALVRSRIGLVDIMIGDRPATDGGLARRLGIPFGLVLSGVTPSVDAWPGPPPDSVAPDLGSMVELLVGGDSPALAGDQ